MFKMMAVYKAKNAYYDNIKGIKIHRVHSLNYRKSSRPPISVRNPMVIMSFFNRNCRTGLLNTLFLLFISSTLHYTVGNELFSF